MRNKRAGKCLDDENSDDRLFRACFTLHPPDKDYPVDGIENTRAYYAEVELTEKKHKDASQLIRMRRGSFLETKNPVYAIEALILAHDAGLYPPIWVLDFMHEVFAEYHKSQGVANLDKLFGFSKGRGQSNAFQEVHNYDRDQILMIDVGRLIAVYDCTVDEAAHMVYRRLEETPEEDFKYVKKLSADTIKDRYLREWKNIVKPRSQLSARSFGGWTDDMKHDYLKNYPEDSIPQQLRHILKSSI